jgi:hypothetical protein
MSQDAVFGTARSSVKSTYKNLSDVLSAYWSGNRRGNGLVDILHNSPRLDQWAKIAEGYRIWSTDEALSVTVTPEKIYTTKGNRVDDVQDGLPAQALYNAIQTAQAIVKTNGVSEDEDEWFEPGDESFSDGAALDAALAETHSEPLVEDDAELIEDVCQETISPTPDAVNVPDDEPKMTPDDYFEQDSPSDEQDENASGYLVTANRKNTVTDGVICSYCGNLNQSAYKGTCPKCPRVPSGEGAKQAALVQDSLTVPKKDVAPGRDNASEAWLMARLKSLQGRVLTILDASPIADKAQRDAVKSLLNKEFRREMNRVSDGGWRAKDPRYEE